MDEEQLDRRKRTRVERLTRGLELYFAGAPMHDVTQVAQVGERRFFRIVDRCLKIAPDQRIWGRRALVSGLRLGPPVRSAPLVRHANPRAGYQGALRMFLHDHLDIKVALEKTLARLGPKVLALNSYMWRGVHRAFIAACTEANIPEDQYPLNTREKAKRSLRRWVETDFVPRYASQWAGAEYGESAQQALDYSRGDGGARRPAFPYRVWQIDEVTIDVRAKFALPNAFGDWEEYELPRAKVIRAIDVGSDAKLANRLVLALEASGEDVSILLWRAISGTPSRHKLAIPGLVPSAGAGYPADVIPELQFATPVLVMLDNALAHLADHVQHIIGHLWGGRVRLGAPGTPQERATMEAEYSAQAKKLLRKLPAATGSSPQDPIRRSIVGTDDMLFVNELEQVIDVYVQNENVCPAAAAGQVAPFERLRRQLASGTLQPAYLPVAKRSPHFFSRPQRVVVHCDLAPPARRPYINYLYYRYSSETLRSNFALRGKPLWARADLEDLRKLILFDESGREFCWVTVLGSWADFPHDVRIRKLFGRLKREGSLGPHAEDAPLDTLFGYLRKAAPADRRAAMQLAYLTAYLDRHANTLSPAMLQQIAEWIEGELSVQNAACVPVPEEEGGHDGPPSPHAVRTGRPSSPETSNHGADGEARLPSLPRPRSPLPRRLRRN